MLSNLLHKNKSASTLNGQSSLAANPLINNATQMNNEFLTHHKHQHINQQGSWSQQTPILPQTFSQSPLLAQTSSTFTQSPILTQSLTQQSVLPFQSRGLSYRKGGPYQQIRLRSHNWGQRSENGWSGFNNWKYQSQNLSSWEHKSIILEELRSQYRGQNRGLGQQSFGALPLTQQAPIISAPIISAPLAAAPFAAAPLAAAPLKGKKSKRGHHHGTRSKRAQAVLPHQSLNGGPAIGTLAPAPLMAAPIIAAPIQRSLPVQQSFVQQQSFVRSADITSATETIMKPAIIQETVRTDRVLEVQKIVHREVEQPIVHHIEKHITEAPAANMGGVVRMAPIVQQNMNTRVINEVTPIVHREVAVRQVERVEEHLQERVVAPTQHTNSVQYESVALPAAPVAAPIIARELPAQSPTLLAPINAPAIHETLSLAPIVDEKIRTDRVVEIQPVVHREVERNVVNHIEKHITEPAAANRGGVVRMAPIVQESQHTRVIEEIQPVVHRERVQLQAERVEEHVVEHIVAPTQHTNTVVSEAAPIAPIANLNLSSNTLNTNVLRSSLEAPLTNTTPITKVVPTLEKKYDNVVPLPLAKNTYGSAMM